MKRDWSGLCSAWAFGYFVGLGVMRYIDIVRWHLGKVGG